MQRTSDVSILRYGHCTLVTHNKPSSRHSQQAYGSASSAEAKRGGRERASHHWVYRGLKCRHCRHCLPRLVGLPPPNYTYNLAHITPSGSLGGSTHTTWRTATTGGPRSPPQGELKAMLSSHSCRHHHAPPPTPPLWPLHHHHHPHPWYTRGQRPGSSPGGC